MKKSTSIRLVEFYQLVIAATNRVLLGGALDVYSLAKFLFIWYGLRIRENDIVLDIGGGKSELGRLFCSRAKLYINIDLEQEHFKGSLLRARKNLKRQNNSILVKGDARAIPLEEEVIDKILCSELIEHIPSPEMVIAEITRVLRRGGRCVITTPDGDFLANYAFPVIGKKEYELLEQRNGHLHRLNYSQMDEWARQYGLKCVFKYYARRRPFGAAWWELGYRLVRDKRVFIYRLMSFLSWIPFILDMLFDRRRGLYLWLIMQKH